MERGEGSTEKSTIAPEDERAARAIPATLDGDIVDEPEDIGLAGSSVLGESPSGSSTAATTSKTVTIVEPPEKEKERAAEGHPEGPPAEATSEWMEGPDLVIERRHGPADEVCLIILHGFS
jgi:hypothetical protein